MEVIWYQITNFLERNYLKIDSIGPWSKSLNVSRGLARLGVVKPEINPPLYAETRRKSKNVSY
jgi:hypothetical protein